MNKFKREIHIKSRLDDLVKVQKFLDEIFDFFHIPERMYGNVYLSVEEAIKNAILHGSKGNVKEEIRIVFKKTVQSISFVIEDTGKGFNTLIVSKDRWQKEFQGNGIFLIKSLTDEFFYNEKGNKLTMIFFVSGIDPEMALTRAMSVGSYLSGKKITVK